MVHAKAWQRAGEIELTRNCRNLAPDEIEPRSDERELLDNTSIMPNIVPALTPSQLIR